MKKHIIALAALATLSVGAAGQASASSLHTVESGETLWSISQEASMSVEELQTLNGIKSTLIYPSQKLKIEDNMKVHVVVKGDTLFEIAQQNNLSVNELMNKNGISSDIIHPGEKLIIEGSKIVSAQSSTHNVVKKADTSATKEMTVTATAYTANCDGCSGITAAGIDLRSNPDKKVIAVDPSVIPMGTRVWVEGYGEAVAGDTGSSIKGNRIDVFMGNEQDALNWGRKTVTIKFLD